MAGFLVVLRKDDRPANCEHHAAMLRALRLFGANRHSHVDQGRFTLMWAHDAGYTPHDVLERQPVEEQGRWHLVFTGFLMHRDDLSRELRIDPAAADRMADSVLAMKAWLAWGEDCAHRLHGNFAFAVCDSRDHRIFAARSPERGTSLFYHADRDRLVLATTIKPLFQDPAVPKVIDEQRIADALILNHEDRERSYFEGIRIVPGGYCLRATPDRLGVAQYYDLARVGHLRLPRDRDYVEAANELFGRAIGSAMRACQTPAISLSSGLDSSAVAVAMIDRMAAGDVPHEAPIRAFTSVPASYWDGRARPGWHGDERSAVEALARLHPAIETTFLDADCLPFDHGLDLIQSYADMPIRGVGNHHWGVEIARACRAAGSRVLMTGSSGNGTLSMGVRDTIFGKWLREGRWLRMLREHRVQGGPTRKLVGRALLPNLPDWLHDRRAAGDGSGQGQGFGSFSAINADFARDMRVTERMAELGWDDRYRKPRSRRELMRIMFQRGARDQAGALAESYKAVTGVESRDPMGDRRIVEFCYAIPDEQFFLDGQDRSLIRRMMAGRLPREIERAPRGEQGADWHARMRRDLPRIDAELDRLSDDPAMASRLDIERMRTCIARWPAQTPLSAADSADFALMRYGIGRALAVARFIHQVEGRN